MYSLLYDSMVIWYRRWYSRDLHLHVMAAVALSLLMAFNIFSVINVLTIFGHRSALNITASTPFFLLWCGLTVLHLGLAAWKAAPKRKQRVDPSASRQVAIWYMIVSTSAFFATFAWLATTET